jgi:hypothetical protein
VTQWLFYHYIKVLSINKINGRTVLWIVESLEVKYRIL